MSVVLSPDRFDLFGPLPEGTTVLEASAGTGKTYTIAALVARYVAEGVADMDRLLVVSFSRESTRELRERVRERLVSARDGLTAPAPDDELVAHLRACGDAELRRRRERLAAALAGFDAATVTTIHGFCQQALLALGTAGDTDPGAILVEDVRDLVREVADDLYLRKWGVGGALPPALNRADFLELATAAALDPATPLVPEPDESTRPGLRARIAGAIRTEVERRKWRLHLIGYDDMLTRLAETLSDPEFGRIAVERLAGRYDIVLVDEFQDTDPVQWSILRSAFHDRRRMVLIGDPKQAIYRFRGADVHSYLDAALLAGAERTLSTSYRADALLLSGLDAVFRGAALGDPRIRVVPTEAAHRGRMVETGTAPARLKILRRGDVPGDLTRDGLAKAGPAREVIADDVAAEAVRLLVSARVHPRDASAERALLPGDIAVLVRDNNQAAMVAAALAAAGVPAVMTGRRSVFATDAAQQWQLLLEALEQPHRSTRVRQLALGCFVGLTAAQLDADGDRHTELLALQLRAWARLLDERGVAALFELVCAERGVPARILARRGGERLLTDLRHIAAVLHEAGLTGRLGPAALLTWLRRRREEAQGDGGLERSRRLESDAAAVQVITVHTSKGLEFPVTMVPFAWSFWQGREESSAVFHDDDGTRRRDVGGPGGDDWDTHLARHRSEEADDELRLAYVALTRAQSHLVAWWAATSNTKGAPLHRLLLAPDPPVLPESLPVPADDDAFALFAARAASSAGGLAVEYVVPGPVPPWSPPDVARGALDVGVLGRGLDLTWRRTSYSALTAALHEEPRLGSEAEVGHRDDETDVDETGAAASPADEPLRAVASPWNGLPSGAAFGTLVHGVLEAAADPADDSAVRELVARATSRSATAEGPLGDALLAALATPLGPLADDRALREFPSADRLPELDFELPLAGGDRPSETSRALAGLVPLWRTHCRGSLAAYGDALGALPTAPLRGYLTGSIDAVLRVGGRYLVADYKTNRLGGVDEALSAWHYRPAALEQAMIDAHYPLQALLYQVALHRYLRWRLPGYDPAQHLGGSLYLFLRGMTPGTGSAAGVFAWRTPPALVLATSELLAGTS